ncbi:hypothetical protein PV08_00699 [Exophiala spinifera]|uniref:Zn(2)-C6 fungal-type domain-containing protein n=1 Tax=Exophiala spinifera TaxID=91928 RepID=A0A0D2C979_9EURO|nr:uncharacterized protein PV08_00699 [Exophiala spinifera]KIW20124.1 hypothetical protein PV08_00699 [Exophiala spinifera]
MADASQSDGDSNTFKIVPACDTCRARKIRCDRKTPCSSCQSSGASCHTSKRKPEKRQRVLISGRYEREIEKVNDRLARLETLLQAANSRQARLQPSPQSYAETLSTPRDKSGFEKEPDFAGDSSFVAHSKDATQAFERSLNLNVRGDVAAAVATLRTFLDNDGPSVAAGSDTALVQKPIQEAVLYPELAKLELPSMQVVLGVLRHAKTHPYQVFYEYPLLDVERLSDLCRKIYFPTDDYTIATFITVHVALYFLCNQMPKDTAKDLNFSSDELQQLADTCAHNAETAMRSMRLFMEASFETIEALLLAAMMTVEHSNLSLGWTLMTTASRMLQDAGYHRLPPYSVAPEATKKRIVFWLVYALERSLALCLGRSSNIQDCDITVERPKVPEELNGPFGLLYLGWIHLGELQGQIYEQLYCARAQKQSPEAKGHVARALAGRLFEMEAHFKIEIEGYPFAEAVSENLHSTRISLATLLTLIYRMIPPDPLPSGQPHHPLKFHDLAIKSAREAVIMHNDAWNVLRHRQRQEWYLFVVWTVQWSPFVPYIVVFGNAIADRNVEDLQLLKEVVDGLESIADMSPGAGKLYRSCQKFYQIASIYLAQVKADNNESQQGSSFDSSGSSARKVSQPAQAPAPAPAQTSISSLDASMSELPLFQQDWDEMLEGWQLRTDGGDTGDISAFFGQYLGGGAGNFAEPPTEPFP